MAKHNETGQQGETLARSFLERKGYHILETNWRHSRAEIDLIAMDGPILVFVEVKTRSNDAFGGPETFVNSQKEARTVAAASAYMEAVGHEWEVRFDIISVLLTDGGNFRIEHFEDAFFPGL